MEVSLEQKHPWLKAIIYINPLGVLVYIYHRCFVRMLEVLGKKHFGSVGCFYSVLFVCNCMCAMYGE